MNPSLSIDIIIYNIECRISHNVVTQLVEGSELEETNEERQSGDQGDYLVFTDFHLACIRSVMK